MALINRRRVTVLTCWLLSVVLGACAQNASQPQTQPPDSAAKPAATPAASTQKPSPAAATQKPGAPATQKPAAPANTSPAKPMIATSPDGTKIAYEVTGSGPHMLLVHGGGQTRRSWNQLGYVDRLAKRYTVITMDLRGVGDSDRPTKAEFYALDRVLADIMAVADAAGAKRFHLYAFGHGGTLARYLAAKSDRVGSAVLVGMTMGPAATGVFKTAIEAMRAKWQPVLAAHTAGTLDVKTLSASDRTAWESGIASNVLMLGALLDYPPLEPADIKVPTLWAVGSEDSAVENLKEYEPKLKGTQVTAKILSSVNYSDSFVKVEQVLAEVEPFWAKAAPTTN
jgi:pimeloyl-ACP methyl ester carboxylesterase